MDTPRILLVDDEVDIVSALQERLTLRGFVVDGVTDGAAALSRLEGTTYDVVLLDMKMPPPGGLPLLRHVKDRWPDVAVVLFTGYGAAEGAKKGLPPGAFDCLMKPVQIDALVRVLRSAAKRKAQPRE